MCPSADWLPPSLNSSFFSFVWFGFRPERIRLCEEIQKIYRRHQMTKLSAALLEVEQEFEQFCTLYVNPHRNHSSMME
jgi:hypothetical protein